MAYCSIDDVRAEGVTEEQAADERVTLAIRIADRQIDRICGWWFEPKSRTLRLDGSGNDTLILPCPAITLESVTLGASGYEYDLDDIEIVDGAPFDDVDPFPRLFLPDCRSWPEGRRNIVVVGTFGYTEPDPDDDENDEGVTPAAIRRASVYLATKHVLRLSDDIDEVERAAVVGRIVEERTRDQSIRLSESGAGTASFTGDPVLDDLLGPYVRHMSGAVV